MVKPHIIAKKKILLHWKTKHLYTTYETFKNSNFNPLKANEVGTVIISISDKGTGTEIVSEIDN